MQPVDLTTLCAAWQEFQAQWVPARLEQVCQGDRYTVVLGLRTLERRGWLAICWHPQAARLGLTCPPPKVAETFTFSQQLRHQLQGLALVSLDPLDPWERVLDLQFSSRPGEPARWHLYAEVMGKYSNLILTTGEGTIVTAAHQVSPGQSRVRPIQTGQLYTPPPALQEPIPRIQECQVTWQARIALIPGPLGRNLLRSYRGLSSALVKAMVQAAGLDPCQPTATLSPGDWDSLFERWQEWLQRLEGGVFHPALTEDGYTVVGWGARESFKSVQALLDSYYPRQLQAQQFQQLHHQVRQKVLHQLTKLRHKAADFQARLASAAEADQLKGRADLLMAHLQVWQPGLSQVVLADFVTGAPQMIALNPEKTAIQNAQALYRQHQKLKRSRANLEPLLQAAAAEINYLEQVEATLDHLEGGSEDLAALGEVLSELQHQGYGEANPTRGSAPLSQPRCFQTPSGFEVWVGRNNRQNDYLTFKLATEYDLWLHAQEIPGSHILLRLPAGAGVATVDLQFAADCAAYFSRARQSEQVPVVYTRANRVRRPKGGRPGLVVYDQAKVLWGKPHQFGGKVSISG